MNESRPRRFDPVRAMLALAAAKLALVAYLAAVLDGAELTAAPLVIFILGPLGLAALALALVPGARPWSGRRRLGARVLVGVWLALAMPLLVFGAMGDWATPEAAGARILGVTPGTWTILAAVLGPVLLALASSGAKSRAPSRGVTAPPTFSNRGPLPTSTRVRYPPRG